MSKLRGSKHVIGGHTYMGEVPKYEYFMDPNGITGRWLKVTKGIPFVRVTTKTHSTKRLALGKR